MSMILDNVLSLMGKLSSFASIVMGFQSPPQAQEDHGDRFDHILDHLQRLPRLVLFLAVMGVFVWPIFDPKAFTDWTTAVTAIPENLWYLIFVVLGGMVTGQVVSGFRSNYQSYQSYQGYQSYSDPMGSTYAPVAAKADPNADHHDLIQTQDTHNDSIAAWKSKVSPSS